MQYPIEFKQLSSSAKSERQGYHQGHFKFATPQEVNIIIII